MLINLKSDKPKSLSNSVIKLSGNGEKFGRTIFKLNQCDNDYFDNVKTVIQ